MAKIEDFGEKIGGAKKDLFQKRSLTSADIAEWIDMEKDKFVEKI